MEELDNPILYIEEFGSKATSRHRHLVPGAVMVYRTRQGTLCVPRGGFTPGELLWRRPRQVYLVDVAPHLTEADCVLTFGPEAKAIGLSFTIVWQVLDPIAAVANRLSQPRALAQFVIEGWCHEVIDVSSLTTPNEVYQAVSRQLPTRMVLPEGIRIDLAVLRAVSDGSLDGSSRAAVVAALLGDDYRAAWRRDLELAQTALFGLPAGSSWTTHEILAEEVVALSRRALERYGELVERLETIMPFTGEAEL